MDAIVAHFAVAGRPEPVPVVVQLPAHQRRLRRRAAPEVVVDRGGHRRRRVDLADSRPGAVNDGAGRADRAKLTAVEVLECLVECRAGSALRAHLDHAAVLSGRGDHLPAFPDIVRQRLFHVDVFARLARPHGGQGVPMVRRGDDDGVDILVVKQFADIAVNGDIVAAVLERLGFTVQVGTVHVAQRDDSCSRDLAQRVDELVPSPPDTVDRGDVAETHDTDTDIGVGSAPFRRRLAAKDKAWQSQRGCRSHRAFQKLPACGFLHGLVPGSR